MKKILGVLAIVAGLWIQPAVAEMMSGQSLVDTVGHIADVLETVVDEDSARAAGPDLAKELTRLKEYSEELEQWSESDMMAFLAVYGEEYQSNYERMTAGMRNLVEHPELFDILSDQLDTFKEIN